MVKNIKGFSAIKLIIGIKFDKMYDYFSRVGHNIIKSKDLQIEYKKSCFYSIKYLTMYIIYYFMFIHYYLFNLVHNYKL